MPSSFDAVARHSPISCDTIVRKTRRESAPSLLAAPTAEFRRAQLPGRRVRVTATPE